MRNFSVQTTFSSLCFHFIGGVTVVVVVVVVVVEDAVPCTGTESWGYTTVRPEAHLFWWLYKAQDYENYPLILWLQVEHLHRRYFHGFENDL